MQDHAARTAIGSAPPWAALDRDHRPARSQAAIELQLNNVWRLFHTLDPLPYRERDLDPQVEDFVVDWARELGGSQPLEIVIHLPRLDPETPAAHEIEAAVNSYFGARAGAVRRQHLELLRTGRISLAVGLAVLGACLIAARVIGEMIPGDLGRFLGEGLIILGWVANWRPIEIFLYDWWPLVRRRRLYDRLSRSHVRLLEAT